MRRKDADTSSLRRVLVSMFLMSVILSAISSLASAQVRIVGAMSGTVTDESGGIIPGARVQLSDESTGIRRETVTNESGGFLFPDLNFGSYQLTITHTGFQTAIYRKVIV